MNIFHVQFKQHNKNKPEMVVCVTVVLAF